MHLLHAFTESPTEASVRAQNWCLHLRDALTDSPTQLVRALGAMVGGGGGGSAEVAFAGGRDASQIDAALLEARRLLSA